MTSLVAKVHLHPAQKQFGIAFNEVIPDNLYYHIAKQTLAHFELQVADKNTEEAMNLFIMGYINRLYQQRILNKVFGGAWVVCGDLPDMVVKDEQ